MTNAISSISSSAASSSSSTTTLSSDTKKKLQVLGLDSSKYKTEAQAQEAITQAQSQTSGTQTVKGGCASCTNCGKCGKGSTTNISSIQTSAKDLASKMGVSVGTKDELPDILSKISDKISELESSAGSDSTKLSDVDSYKKQFQTLAGKFEKISASQNMTGASALASYNKAALGLSA